MKKFSALAFACAGISLLFVAGCSKSDTTNTTAATSAPTTKAGAGSTTGVPTTKGNKTVATLNSSNCLDLATGNLDLLTASTRDDARKGADAIEKFNPPAEVKAAAEHFVDTKGAQYDDPDFSKNSALVKDWVAASCPDAASSPGSSNTPTTADSSSSATTTTGATAGGNAGTTLDKATCAKVNSAINDMILNTSPASIAAIKAALPAVSSDVDAVVATDGDTAKQQVEPVATSLKNVQDAYSAACP